MSWSVGEFTTTCGLLVEKKKRHPLITSTTVSCAVVLALQNPLCRLNILSERTKKSWLFWMISPLLWHAMTIWSVSLYIIVYSLYGMNLWIFLGKPLLYESKKECSTIRDESMMDFPWPSSYGVPPWLWKPPRTPWGKRCHITYRKIHHVQWLNQLQHTIIGPFSSSPCKNSPEATILQNGQVPVDELPKRWLVAWPNILGFPDFLSLVLAEWKLFVSVSSESKSRESRYKEGHLPEIDMTWFLNMHNIW